jgi:tRNA(Ile)-lysidine synthase
MSRHEPLLADVAAALREAGACALGASPIDTIVVAVSGGPDSVCLLDALSRLLAPQTAGGRGGRPMLRAGLLHVAHLHHGLRGRDADRDEAFVQRSAARYGWPVTVGHADIRREAARQKQSVQVAAREHRYRFLSDVAERAGASWIAVAHTANDQAETLLLRLVRGTGPDGLAGMGLVREGRIVRPLLRVTRAAVLDYLRRRGLTYRRDRSNQDPHYTRNRIRADLLPRLAADYNPAIVSLLATTAGLMAEERQVVEEVLSTIWQASLTAVAPDRLTFDRTIIARQPPAVQRWWLRRALRLLQTGPAAARAGTAGTIQEALRRLRGADQGTVAFRGETRMVWTREQLHLVRPHDAAAPVERGARRKTGRG